MRKIYIIFSLLCLIVFIFFDFLEKKEIKNIKKEEKVTSLEADIILEISNIIFKKVYKGKIFFQKPYKVTLVFKENKEYFEIGSNEKYFWYYNNKEDILYYGNIFDVHNILKEIFNPINIIEIILPHSLDFKQNDILEDALVGDYGALLKREIFIKNYKITEQKVYCGSELLYTIKIYNYYKNIPTNLYLNYIKEKYNVNIKLSNININKQLINRFDLPTKKYKNIEILSP